MKVRRAAICAALLLACILPSCSGSRKGLRGAPADPQGSVGVYRATTEDSKGHGRSFKLLLWAGLPDRIHAEALSPMGTIVAVVDGGNGDVVVTLPRDGLTFAGAADAGALAHVLGVQVGLGDLVAALLTGAIPEGEHRMTRRPERGEGLPEWIELRGATGALTLELRRRQRLPDGAAVGTGLGTGVVPPGVEARPLDELILHDLDTGDGEGE